MSVRVRRHRSGGYEVDIRYVLAEDGRRRRERRKAPVSSRSAALRWGLARERELVLGRKPEPVRKEVPTLREFAEDFMTGYARANRHKPSGIATKESIVRLHLLPHLGERKLDEITNADVQMLKGTLSAKSPKTVNNILSVLNTMLRTAEEWNVIESVQCRVRMLKVPPASMEFYDFDEFERLVDAAGRIDRTVLLTVLLAGEAGLRCGEVMALRRTDVDFERRVLTVRHSDWKGHVTAPKSGRERRVPMTRRLAAELEAHRHLRSERALSRPDGSPLTQKITRSFVEKAARRAGLRSLGIHALRHSFASHLVMKGAPARAVQALLGHGSIVTSQRYMHLSPRAVESAIELLERPGIVPARGAIWEPQVGLHVK